MRRFFGMLLLCLVLAVTPRTTLAATPEQALPQSLTAAYRVSTGDYLAIGSSVQNQIFVEQAPETSAGRAYPVRPDGRITLPLIGEVEVGGLTVPEILLRLKERFRPFLGDAHFTVNVIKFHPMTLSVMGAVPRAGSFEFTEAPSLFEALSKAGGITDWAARHVVVLRQGKVVYDLNLDQALKGELMPISLQDRDVIQVHTQWYKPYVETLPILASIMVTLSTLIVFVTKNYTF